MRSHVWHDSLICVTWLFLMCDMTLSYVWHDCFICVTRLFHMCDMTLFICVPWLFSYVWHDSFTCVTWLNHPWRIHKTAQAQEPLGKRVMSQYDSFICVTWLFHMCDMTLSYVWHDSTPKLKNLMTKGEFFCATGCIRLDAFIGGYDK